jgi:hypothetical protein
VKGDAEGRDMCMDKRKEMLREGIVVRISERR